MFQFLIPFKDLRSWYFECQLFSSLKFSYCWSALPTLPHNPQMKIPKRNLPMGPRPTQINPELKLDVFGHTFPSILYPFSAKWQFLYIYKAWQLRQMTIEMHQMSSTVILQSRLLPKHELVWKTHHMLLSQALTNQNAGSGRIRGNGGLHPPTMFGWRLPAPAGAAMS